MKWKTVVYTNDPATYELPPVDTREAAEAEAEAIGMSGFRLREPERTVLFPPDRIRFLMVVPA